MFHRLSRQHPISVTKFPVIQLPSIATRICGIPTDERGITQTKCNLVLSQKKVPSILATIMFLETNWENITKSIFLAWYIMCDVFHAKKPTCMPPHHLLLVCGPTHELTVPQRNQVLLFLHMTVINFPVYTSSVHSVSAQTLKDNLFLCLDKLLISLSF